MIAFRRGLGATTSYDSLVTSLAAQYNVPPSLALAIMQAESSGNPNAVSSAGAQGLFQIMPANDASLGITNPYDPTQNASGGLNLLSQYYQQFGNWTQALEAYNEGPGALQKQIAAGTTPVSEGYATSILSSAGISDSTDTSTSADTASLTSSLDLSYLTDLPTETGLSWGTLAAIGGGLFVFALALAARR